VHPMGGVEGEAAGNGEEGHARNLTQSGTRRPSATHNPSSEIGILVAWSRVD
jgi:hypothetical protein